ncbi:MAG: fumarate hydratase C-terminal domain-containing protein [bacterium]
MKNLTTPINSDQLSQLKVGDMITISGKIFTGRDAVLPKIVALINSDKLSNIDVDFQGAVMFHTAVSPAGVGPTSSNKLEIESSFPALSYAGLKMHLGKGKISDSTIESLDENNSCYAIIPPVTALLESRIKQRKVMAFPELGMEALHLLEVEEFPVIIAAIHGETIYK